MRQGAKRGRLTVTNQHSNSIRARALAWLSIGVLGLTAVASPASAAAPARAARPACCKVAAGTAVMIELVDEVSSKTQKRGDTFTIRLAAPLILNGQVVLRAGTRGAGEVIDVHGPGIGGKPGKMVLAADYLVARNVRVPLNALQLAGRGHDNSTPATVLEIGGIASLPLSLAGIILPGGEVAFKPGARAIAKVAGDVTLPPLGRATRRDIALAKAADAPSGAADQPSTEATNIPIPPPPPGQGQVVFFRGHTLLGTAQWFKVRENGQALGKLTNGAYFVQPETPGVHSFTAKLEPELKDTLHLQIDPGQTYFVEGTLTAGLVLSAADLVPSTADKFNKSKGMKLAPPPRPDDGPDQLSNNATGAADNTTAPQ